MAQMIQRIECVLIKKREEISESIRKQTPNIDEATLQKRVKIQETTLAFYNKSNWTLKSILKESASQVEALLSMITNLEA